VKRGAWSEDLIEAICREIKVRRKELGLSVYALSQDSGVSQQAIANYEQGVRRPALDCLLKVARGLKLEPSELLARAEAKVRSH
jgi:transcriptional regulator with XRE-family HTH domain